MRFIYVSRVAARLNNWPPVCPAGGLLVAGLDEVAGGRLAGPVFIAVVILPADAGMEGRVGTRKLSARLRTSFECAGSQAGPGLRDHQLTATLGV